ncbi:cadherin domain-containing protein [Candidatus Poribacteria bacterium]|nr:cadherin domain-containing protein [Candidatus Poribacteria bacterium]
MTNDFLDFETKSSYSLTITVSDGNDGTDSIAVTILITDVDERATNNVPTFTEGDEASRAVDENTALGVNLGDPFTATDGDGDTLTYLLGGVDAGSFTIDSESGQLKTNEPLDFERKPTYSITISVSDGQGGFDKIAVLITVTDVAELGDNTPPVFTEGELATRTIEENTEAGVNIGEPISATDVDGDLLTYGITGTDSAAFSFDNTTGQIQTNQPLDFETKPTYVVTVAASDGRGGSVLITVTINVTDVFELPANNPPVFNEGSETTRSISENSLFGIPVGSAVTATDLDGDNLSYTLIGPDAEIFSISSSTGQISTSISLDFESQSEYSLIVTVTDGNGGSASIPVTIFITNVNEIPSFNDGGSTTRTIAENSAAGIDIGSPIAASDEDGDTLTYVLGGTDADSFSVEVNTGQLLTKEPLDFETKASYSLTVAVSDPDGEGDNISVTINIIDLEEAVVNIHAPVFNEGQSATRSIAENTASNVDIGDPFTATDQDSTTLTYRLSGSDASHFSISGATGQLKTNSPLDREETASYSVNVIASDGQLSASIAVTIEITDINEPPRFPNLGTSVFVDENTPPGTPIGSPIEATDNDLNTELVYSIAALQDGSHFDINSETGQLLTKRPLNYESKSIRLLFVQVTDGEFTARISVTIALVDLNDPPIFNEGEETTRTIDENTPSGVAIGGAVAATDVDQGLTVSAPDVLTYSLGGVDASSFTIDSSSGQISTSAALDHETKETYSVTVTVTDNAESELPTDPGELTDEITVTITVADVNEAPVFAEGDDTVRSIDENTASGVAIGSTISASDVDDGDVLTYTMAGASASSFSIDSSTGQIRTNAPLNFEVTNTFSVTVTVTDNGGPDGPSGILLTDTISVTININDINDAPVFTEGDSANRNIDENTSSGVTIGSVVGATDEDTNPVDTMSYSLDSSTDAGAFSINSSTGQISTSGALDHETQDSYTFSVTVSDQRTPALTDTITMTIAINDVNEAPIFTDGTETTRSVDENSDSGTNIGSIVGATDEDRDPVDTLTYTLSGTDSGSFNIDSNTGQLKTSAELNYEVKNTYSVSITVSDNESPALTDSIDVTININDVNDAPVFSDGESTTRSVDENTASGNNIGSVVSATDEDTLPSADTLTYTLGGTDSGSFTIVSTTGQLQTSSSLNYETKPSYSVTVTVTDNGSTPGLTDTIAVTINLNDVNDAPVFSDGESTMRNVDENTASGNNIGSVVSATDEDTLPSADTLTYTLGGTDSGSFTIVSTTGQLQTSSSLNYESKTTYSVTITVTDNGSTPGLTDSISVTININDVNEAPTFPSATTALNINENVAAASNIGSPITASDVDAGDSISYSLGGDDADDFDIGSTSGQVQTKSDLDFEDKSSYTVVIIATDSGTPGLTGMITATITVNDINDAPVFSDGESTMRSVDENTTSGSNIGAVVGATDEDTLPSADTLTYTLGGTDAASFAIVSTTGQLQTNAALDYETKTSYSVTITVTDNGSTPGLTDSINVTININDVNEIPFFSTDVITYTVDESLTTVTNIGSPVTATDPDGDTLTYSLDTTSDTIFDIDSMSGQIKTEITLDYDIAPSYTVTVTATDNGTPVLMASKTVTINVNNLNAAPVFPSGSDSRSIDENNASGANVGAPIIATDSDAGDMITYTLAGTDSGSFSIDSSGQITTSLVFNFEVKSSYSVTVTATDDSGESNDSTTVTVTINILDINDRPEPTFDPLITNIDENNSIGSIVGGTLFATDEDIGDTLTYTLDGPDKDSFQLVVNEVNPNARNMISTEVFDFETKDEYDVSFIATDTGGLSAEVEFDIRIRDLNDAPEFSAESGTRTILENTAAGEPVGDPVVATDEDETYDTDLMMDVPKDTLIYSLEGDDAAHFGINSETGQILTSGELDYENTTQYTVVVKVQDRPDDNEATNDVDESIGQLTDTITITISVQDVVGDAPSLNKAQVDTLLLQNYPNPFNPETWIPYQLSKPSDVTVTIFNLKGVVVRELAIGHRPEGIYRKRSRAIYWDGQNEVGEKVATGVYFIHFKAGDFTATRKMLIRK